MAKINSYGSLVGFSTYSKDGVSKMIYYIFEGGDKNSNNGLFTQPRIVTLFAQEPMLSNKEMNYNQKLELTYDIDLTGFKKPRLIEIKAV